MSEAREARKSRLKGARSTTEEKVPEGDVKSSRSSMSSGQASQRKVNSLNPLLVAAVRVPLGPQLLHLLPFLAYKSFNRVEYSRVGTGS
jgi:hypothetical protein